MSKTNVATDHHSPSFLISALVLIALLIATRMIDPATAFADTNSYDWTKVVDQNLLGGGYTSVASSSDGSHLITATTNGSPNSPLFVSSNYGATWQNVTPNPGYSNSWQSVSVSDNGETMVAASNEEVNLGNSNTLNGQIFISFNAGNTWQDITPNTGTTWQNIAISGNGSTISAVSDDETNQVYISGNDGSSWTTSPTTSDVNSWQFLSISDNGNKILAGGENVNALTSVVDYSDNNGTTWTDVTPDSGNQATFAIRASMSSSGNEIAVSTYGYVNNGESDVVYMSSNSGANWTDVTPDQQYQDEWSAVALSGNGDSLVVGNNNNNTMYVSSDDGAEWNEEDPSLADQGSNNWQYYAFNSDGSRLIAVSSANEYVGYVPGLVVSPNTFTQTVASQASTTSKSIITPDTGYGEPVTISGMVKDLVILSVLTISSGLVMIYQQRKKFSHKS